MLSGAEKHLPRRKSHNTERRQRVFAQAFVKGCQNTVFCHYWLRTENLVWLCDFITERRRPQAYSFIIIRHQTGEIKMTVNMGSADRIIRAIVDIVLIALVFVGPQTAWGWIGVVPLATAARSEERRVGKECRS